MATKRLVCPKCGGAKDFYALACRRCATYPKPKGRQQPFDKSIHKTESCWLWTGKLTKKGYGQRKVGVKTKPAHRVAWELFCGPIPDGLLVCHRCDVRHCVNPDHLFLGTHDQNMADMVAKKRQPYGRNNAASKVTEEIVHAIRMDRAQGRVLADIGKKFSVSTSQVYRIVQRQSWGHIS